MVSVLTPASLGLSALGKEGDQLGNLNPLSRTCCVTLGKPCDLSVLQDGNSYLQCAETLCE